MRQKVLFGLILLLMVPVAPIAAEQPVTVDGSIALHSLMSLSDNHLQKLADSLRILAATDATRSGRWNRLREPLGELATMNVPAALWFALPDGTYWTVGQGRVNANISDRPYFARVLGGATVIGDLVVSRSTGRNTAIVAVPVIGRQGKIAGVLGASVYLDRLSAIVREEMGQFGSDHMFFAIDAEPLGALHSDPRLIFTKPTELGDEAMTNAFKEMLTRESGVVTYPFRDRQRTMLYEKSPVTRWWYAFGVLR
ncbi:MAG TPA: hypothetical protein VLV78_06475 [Thermoanaerobaculia bacterium]|nr:hypothetical protein [Thermoanaerobaculia bacterium]